MMKHDFLFPILALLVFSSCDKKELNVPTEVVTVFDVDRMSQGENHLMFTSGYISLSEFEINGTRQEGSPVKLKEQYSEGLEVPFTSIMPHEDLQLDIPQGNYTELEVKFKTRHNVSGITIHLEGLFIEDDDDDDVFPIIFEYSANENYKLDVEDIDDLSPLVLSKDRSAYFTVEMDPFYWFDVVSEDTWEDSDKTTMGGIEVIKISSSENRNIYNMVRSRVGESARVKISH